MPAHPWGVTRHRGGNPPASNDSRAQNTKRNTLNHWQTRAVRTKVSNEGGWPEKSFLSVDVGSRCRDPAHLCTVYALSRSSALEGARRTNPGEAGVVRTEAECSTQAAEAVLDCGFNVCGQSCPASTAGCSDTTSATPWIRVSEMAQILVCWRHHLTRGTLHQLQHPVPLQGTGCVHTVSMLSTFPHHSSLNRHPSQWELPLSDLRALQAQ